MGSCHRQGDAGEARSNRPGHSCIFHAAYTVGQPSADRPDSQGHRSRKNGEATDEDLAEFLATWPEIDSQTGLSIRGDELLIKAREAMIAAVHTFNGAGLHFRAELFIVTTIIAWTYLHHAYFRRLGIDYRYFREVDGVKKVETTEGGAEKYWELGYCLKHSKCPLTKGMIDNPKFLLDLRHEIEHRSTSRIDDAISTHLQACCINFNNVIKAQFGPQYGLERRLPIALQFMTFSSDQRAVLKRAANLPRNIETLMDDFSARMTTEEKLDPDFAFRVNFTPVLANRPAAADEVIEFSKATPQEAGAIAFIKEVDRKKYRAGQVVKLMKTEGYPRFTMQSHTDLWRAGKAKDPKLGFGSQLYVTVPNGAVFRSLGEARKDALNRCSLTNLAEEGWGATCQTWCVPVDRHG
jgi:hypothetical protein